MLKVIWRIKTKKMLKINSGYIFIPGMYLPQTTSTLCFSLGNSKKYYKVF